MKKFIKAISLILLSSVVLFSFSSCSTTDDIEITESRLIETKNGVSAIYKIRNNTDTIISNLTVTVTGYNINSEKTGDFEGSYSHYIEADEEATLTVRLSDDCATAEISAYSYTAGSEEIKGEFIKNATAEFPQKTTADKKIDTREELATKVIEDVEHQFMLQKYEAHGYYDKEKNQVVIASYTTKTYDECYYAYTLDPTVYNALAESIAQMSMTCYEEFQNYNFKDVEVSVGFLSSDEKIMISATNGTIVDNFS